MPSTTPRLLLAGALAASVALVPITQVVPTAAAAPGDNAKNVIAGDFPDPGFAKFTTRAGGTQYYLYATGAGFRVASSASPGSGFTIRGNSMPKRPAWTYSKKEEKATGKKPLLWAPNVFATGANGTESFAMYFAAVKKSGKNAGKHCIGAATASSPLGPFKPQKKPIACPPSGYSEAIDPALFVYVGQPYLVYKIGNYSPRRFKILGVKVRGGGLEKFGKTRTILGTKKIGTAVAEAPDLYRDDNGRVHLFVSRNGYLDCDYATQVWSGPSLFRLTKASWVGGMGPQTGDRFCGPGGAEVIRDGNALRIAFHVQTSRDPLVRPAWTGRLDQSGDTFTLR